MGSNPTVSTNEFFKILLMFVSMKGHKGLNFWSTNFGAPILRSKMQTSVKIICEKCGDEISICVTCDYNVYSGRIDSFLSSEPAKPVYIIGREDSIQRVVCRQCKTKFDNQLDALLK